MIRQLYSSWVWIYGFVIGVVAVGLMVLAYMFAPIAVVQTVFGAGLVLVVFASRLYLHEPMERREHLGIYVVIVALILISITLGTANRPGVKGAPFEVLMISGATCSAAFLVFGVLYRYPFGDVGLRFGGTSGLLYGVATLQIKSIAVLIGHHSLLTVIPVVLKSPYPYVFVSMSVLGLLIFQSGLQRSRFVVLVPVTNVVSSVYVVAIGMSVFGETFPRSIILTVLRLMGFALVLVGNWMFVIGPGGSLNHIDS
jgi:hypothetical protein